MDPSGRLQPGQRFGRYQVVRLLGEGGMGSVYEVIHPELKKRFAIKTLLPNLAVIPEARARFLREGEAASRISHPNVVDVTDVGMDDGVAFLVMEFLEGETLGSLLEVRGALRFTEAVDFLLPILSAVLAGHDEGVIHRDLKPQNVFLCKGRWGEVLPKVLDFGVSKLMNSPGAAGALTGTMAVLGTAAYMSPEQARGARDVNARSDQYALGLIFYEMITGHRTYPGDNPLEVLHKIGLGQYESPRAYRSDLPSDLEGILLRMLALDPSDRFPSLRDVGRALMPFASEKARLNWSDAFRVGADAPTLSAAPNPFSSSPPQFASTPAPSPVYGPPRLGRSPSSSSGAAVAGGTRVLPAQGNFPPSSPSSTFNNGAAEVGISRTDLLNGGGSSRRGLWIGGLVVVGVLLGGGGWWMQSRGTSSNRRDVNTRFGERSALPGPGTEQPAQPRQPALGAQVDHEPRREAVTTRTLTIRAIPRDALIILDDGPPSRGEMRATLPVDEASHSLRVSADGYLTRTLKFGPGDVPPNEVELEAEPMRQSEAATVRTPHGKNPPPRTSRRGGGAHEPRTITAQTTRAADSDVVAPPPQPPPLRDKEKKEDKEGDSELRRGVNNALILR